MNIVEILDTSFRTIYYLDTYESFIWTERYNSYGDFELYLPMDATYLEYLQKNNYIAINDSQVMMIIETIEISTDVENGDHLKVSGRSLESILDRRVLWNKTVLVGKLETQIKKLLNENFISPADSSRKISNFVFQNSNDSKINNLNIQAQYFIGDNVYDLIESICKVYDIGFQITINNDKFVFSLYSGNDRSYDIDRLLDNSGNFIFDNESDYIYGYEDSYIVEFSSNFDNLIDSNYFESNEQVKNVAFVDGRSEGTEGHSTTIGNSSGLNRREIYVDATDIQSEGDDKAFYESYEYEMMLKERGYETLAEHTDIQTFEGNVDYTREFVYGVDFFKGDKVRIANAYGVSARVQITEVVRSLDENGYELYPTFEVV